MSIQKLISAFLACSLALSAVAQEIPEATKVRVRLEQQISSATAEENQPVQLSVAEDVQINGVVVIPRDSVVNGTVVQSVPKRRMGRTGKLDFSVDNIVAPDGGKIPVRYSIIKKEGGSTAVSTGIITAGIWLVAPVAAPFMLLRKGKDTVYNKGTTFEVFTDAPYVGKRKTPRAIESVAPLKNEDILTLKTAGFSEVTIVARIASAPAGYALDIQSLIALKNAGLSEDVINAMVKRSSER